VRADGAVAAQIAGFGTICVNVVSVDRFLISQFASLLGMRTGAHSRLRRSVALTFSKLAQSRLRRSVALSFSKLATLTKKNWRCAR
jgi:hypothetical protein